MPLPTFYAVGTASVANGETTIAFSGALLGTAEAPNFIAGDLFFDPAQPSVPGQRIASVDYDESEATLWAGWPGTSLTDDPYEVRYVGDPVRSTAQTRRYIELLGQLASLGIQPNAFGEFADRDEYDDAVKDFIFLSLNGDAGATTTAWTLFTKLSSDDADWSTGQTIEGAQGEQGESGLIGVWKGAWSAGTYDALDSVEHNGASYIANTTTTEEPPHADWDLVADKGDTGPAGADGADGSNGADGADGEDGIMAAVVAGTGIDVDATDPANPIIRVEQSILDDIAGKASTGKAIAMAIVFGG